MTQQKRPSSIFKKPLLDQIPLYYRYMNKVSGRELQQLEFGDFKVSTSRVHRSATYFVYEPYKPYTKFVVTKNMH